MVAQIDAEYFKTRPCKALTRLIAYAFFEGRPVTTKGRWINPLVFLLFRAWRALPAFKPVNAPIFILGTGRSGTTLLGILLSMHRDVGYLNEPKAIWHAAYPYEDIIGNYSRIESRYVLNAKDASQVTAAAMAKMYGAFLAISGCARTVDKYPELVFRVPFVRALFPDARFLFIVRNGLDTAVSIEKWSERHGGARRDETHDWWGVEKRKWRLLVEQVVRNDSELSPAYDRIRRYTDHTCMAMTEWIVSMKAGLRALEAYPDAIHLVRYEDLIADPTAVLKDISVFCELEKDETFLAYARLKVRSAPSYENISVPEEIRNTFDALMQRFDYKK